MQWPAAEILARYLTHLQRQGQLEKDNWSSKQIVELGAGTGVLSMALATLLPRGQFLSFTTALQAHSRSFSISLLLSLFFYAAAAQNIFATDMDQLLPLLRANIELNGMSRQIQPAVLNWCVSVSLSFFFLLFNIFTVLMLLTTLGGQGRAHRPTSQARHRAGSRLRLPRVHLSAPGRHPQELVWARDACLAELQEAQEGFVLSLSLSLSRFHTASMQLTLREVAAADKRFFNQLRKWFTWEEVADPAKESYRRESLYMYAMRRKPSPPQS